MHFVECSWSLQVSPSGSPLCHLSIWPDHLREASIRLGEAFVLGDTRAQREGGPSFYPCFDPPPPSRGASHGFSVSLTTEAGGRVSPVLCTWHSSRMSLLTRQQIDFECTWWLSPFSPRWSPPALSLCQTMTISIVLIKLPPCSGFKRVAEVIVQ